VVKGFFFIQFYISVRVWNITRVNTLFWPQFQGMVGQQTSERLVFFCVYGSIIAIPPAIASSTLRYAFGVGVVRISVA
jgi:hypothetical protein